MQKNNALACLGLVILLSPGIANARRAPGRLHQVSQIASFYRLTGQIRCHCGCNGLAGDCGHVEESCFGVQMRRFVESRLLEGMSEEQIREGVVHGFGPRILTDPQVRELERLGRTDLVSGFQNGFGQRILYREPSSPPVISILLAGCLLGLGVLWLRRRRQRTLESLPSTEPAARLLEKTRTLDA